MHISARRLFVIILFVSIFYCALRTVIDPDFFWHLRTGEMIAQTGAIPSTDPFSFTAYGNAWVTHEWLTELFIYEVYQLGGIGGIIFVFAGLITGIFIFTYLACPDSAKPYVAGFGVLLGALTSAPAWNARPQVFSLLFFSVFLFLLERYRREHRLRYLIPLPLIMVVWVNMHGGFIFGFALIGIYIAGLVIDWIWDRLQHREIDKTAGRQVLTLASALVLTLLASLVNPNGYRLLVYPFQALSDPSLMRYITEFQSPDFHQAMWLPLVGMILLLLISAMKRNVNISTAHLLMIAAFFVLALRSQYHVPFFAIAATPVLVAQFDWIQIPKEVHVKPNKLLVWLNALVVLVVIVIAGWQGKTMIAGQPEAVAYKYPQKAADWILETRPTGNMFNSFNWGGYLIWRLYPDYPVYIDGRPDMYGPSFVTAYTDIYYTKPGWQADLNAADVNFVLIEPDSSLANGLRQDAGWKIAYEDQNSIIFEKE